MARSVINRIFFISDSFLWIYKVIIFVVEIKVVRFGVNFYALK